MRLVFTFFSLRSYQSCTILFNSERVFGMGKITQAKRRYLGGQAFGNPFTKYLQKTQEKFGIEEG